MEILAIVLFAWAVWYWFKGRHMRKAMIEAKRNDAATPAPAGRPAKTYPVSLVGERSYQAAIARCAPGDPATLVHEPDNPHDDAAIAVTAHGATIGYLGRDSWLRDALLAEGKGCTAEIDHLGRDGPGLPVGVRIRVTLAGPPIGERAFAQR